MNKLNLNFEIVNTYADLVARGTQKYDIIYAVKNDEHLGITDSIYVKFATGLLVPLGQSTGTSDTDLSNYYTKAQVDAKIAAIPAGPKGDKGDTGPQGPQGPAGSGSGGSAGLTGVVSPAAYGAVGNNSTDDTAAIQAMFTDAILHSYKIFIPSGKQYKITSTINVIPPTGQSEYRLDLEAVGNSVFYYYGAANTAAFLVSGLRFSRWEGLKAGISTGNTGAIILDLDTATGNPGSGSTSNNVFKSCHFGLGTGTGQIAWRIGKQSANGGDISVITWDNCSVYGNYGNVLTGQAGWHIYGGNTLQNVWNNCFGAFLDYMFTNQDGGNGACYFFGTGTSQNHVDWYIGNMQSYVITGGRLELGKIAVMVGNSNVSPSITLTGVEIDSYNPSSAQGYLDGAVIYVDMPCSMQVINCNFTGAVYSQNMIKCSGGGGTGTFGTLIVDGGAVENTIGAFYTVNTNDTRWSVYTRGVRMMTNNAATGYFPDKSGAVPSGQNR